MFFVVLVDMFLVCSVEVLPKYHISVLPHRLQTGLLSNCRDVGRTDLLRSVHVVLQVNFLCEEDK